MSKLSSFIKNKRFVLGLYFAPAIMAFSIILFTVPLINNGVSTKTIDAVSNSSADVVIGQTDMNSNLINQVGYLKTIYKPANIFSDGTRLFVADLLNNRVLIYNSIPDSNNRSADVVVGQPDMASNGDNTGGVSAKSLFGPSTVFVYRGKMFVADRYNHRVLIFNSIPTSNGASADVVIGQPDMATNIVNYGGVSARSLYNPGDVFTDGTKLVISDSYNNRILIFNSIPTSNYPVADVVIGQPDMTTNVQNYGCPPSSGSGKSLSGPWGVLIVSNRLLISDRNNNRVMVFNSLPTTNYASADVVLGQPDMVNVFSGTSESRMTDPLQLATDGTKLFVADQYNSRVLIFNTVPVVSNTPADVVIGQEDMNSNTINSGGLSSKSLNLPAGVFYINSKLLISDQYNSRVLIYNSVPASNFAPSDIVVGQPDMTSNSDNQTNTSAKANALYYPLEEYFDGTRLFVSERYNNRVLIYNSMPTSNNTPAYIVVGQPDMTSNLANQGVSCRATTLYHPSGVFSDGTRLFITDFTNNRVLIYNSIPASNNASANVVIGQQTMAGHFPNQGGSAGPNTLCNPSGVYSDGTRLFVADYANNRVLIYNTIPTANNASADIVIGQQDMTSNSINQGGSAGANTLYYPSVLGFDGTRLFVADYFNNRVLIYNTIPTSNNAPANIVIGQPNMASNSKNQGGSVQANTLDLPHGLFVPGTKLFVADESNSRVLIYNTIPTGNNASADMVIGQQSMTANSINQGGSVGSNTLYFPTGVYCDGTRLLVSDYFNHRVLIYDLITIKPVISDVRFNSADYVAGDTISSNPLISAKLTDIGGVGGIEISNLKLTADTTLYTYASFDASTDSCNSTTGIFVFKVKNTLSTGTHNVKIEVSDYLGNWATYEAKDLNVNDSSGIVQMDGIPLNYPNPFRPLSETTKITYKLTLDSDILIYIFDLRGVLIKKANYSSGSIGGKAGYNEIIWDGKDDFGSTVGDGIYPFRIVAGGKVLGKGKIAVLE